MLINGLKFSSININNIKDTNLLPLFDLHQSPIHVSDFETGDIKITEVSFKLDYLNKTNHIFRVK